MSTTMSSPQFAESVLWNDEEYHKTTHAPFIVVSDPEKCDVFIARQPKEYLEGPKLWAAMGGLTMVYFLMLMDMSILSTASPEITKEFASFDSIGWYAAAYVLACATLQPLTGKLYTNFSTKWTFFGSFLLFEFGSLLCGVSSSSNMFIVSRAVAGLGASGLQNGSLNIIAACIPMAKRPALMGILMGSGQLGLVAGPLIGGLFTQFVTWRWCFYINLPVGGLVAVLLGFVHIPETFTKLEPRIVLRSIHRKLDLVGFALFAPSVVMLLLAVQWGGNAYGWDSAVIIGLFCGAASALAVWLVWNVQKEDDAMIPLRILRQRFVWTSSLYGAFLAGGLFVVSYYLPIYFQGVHGKSPAISGVYLLPSILSQLFASIVSGRLLGRFGYYLPWAMGSAILTSAGYGLLSTLGPVTAAGQWIGFQIVSGFGRGCGMQVPMIAMQHTLRPEDIPLAMSLLTFVQTISGSIFLSAGATILNNSFANKLERVVPDIDVQATLAAGANGIRDVVTAGVLPAVLRSYAESVDNVFYMCTGLALCCFLLAPWLGWVDIRKEQEEVAATREK